MKLVAEIKEILLDLVPKGAPKAKERVDEVMDIDLYKQMIQNDSFDLPSVIKFVVEMMLGLCAPARDPIIRAILAQNDPVEVFREVFGALDLMRLDLVNYQLRTLRPALLANSVQYEQDKFRSLLEGNPGALDKTKSWLSETVAVMREAGQPATPSATLNNAFIRIIEEKVPIHPVHSDHVEIPHV